MDQYINNSQTELLYNLIANPTGNGEAHSANLQQLVKSFPQSGLLQALLVQAGGAQNLPRAAAYFESSALYTLINDPSGFPVVETAQIFHQPASIALKDYNAPAFAEQEAITDEQVIAEEPKIIETEVVAEEHAIVETEHPEETLPVAEETATEEPIAEEASEYPEVVSTEVEAFEPLATDHFTAEEIPEADGETYVQMAEEVSLVEQTEQEDENIAPAEELVNTEVEADTDVTEEDNLPQDIDGEHEPANETITEPVAEIPAEPAKQTDDIEDEIYDEILGFEHINIKPVEKQADTPFFTYEAPVSAEETEFLEHEAEEAALAAEALQSPSDKTERRFDFTDEADKLIAGNIAATDYFMFDRKFGKEENTSEKVELSPEVETGDDAPNVTRYHDEKMPYSFLWWLDKTRQEHSGIYRPYARATNAVQPPAGEFAVPTNDALQQQYFENIFHLSSVEELDKHTAQNVEFELKPHKGEEIIERFIKEEPQIKPPSIAKLDNENKAKKSAVDQNDLVTETLASIYADQMLYHKAIAIYRKLMLKFPEKSRYFADRIENLEKKTN